MNAACHPEDAEREATVGTPIRLVTLNSWKCDGAYRLRVQAMAMQLRQLAPDVVAIQESFASLDGQHDTARTLAQALGMHCVLAPARRKHRACEGLTLDSHSGLAVLSKWPVTRHAVLPLPSEPADGERIALLCQLRAGAHTLNVANIHLTHLDGAHALRRLQLHTVLAHPWLNTPDDAAVVCGDFNAPLGPDAQPGSLAPPPDWLDAARAGGLLRKVTCPAPGTEGLDLDHVLSRATAPLRWHSAHIALNQRDATTGACPSDHFAVCADGLLLP